MVLEVKNSEFLVMNYEDSLTEEGKKKYSEIKIQRMFHLDSQRSELIFFRFQTLSTISGLATAFGGLILTSTNVIKNTHLAIIAVCVLLVTTLLSLWVYISNGRIYSDYLGKKIQEARTIKMFQESDIKEPELSGEWPERFFFLFVFGIFLFVLAFVV